MMTWRHGVGVWSCPTQWRTTTGEEHGLPKGVSWRQHGLNRRVTARIGDTGGQGVGRQLADRAIYLRRWVGTYVHSSRHTPHTLRINTALGWALGTLRINTPLRPRLIRDSQTLAWTLDLAWTAPILSSSQPKSTSDLLS